MPTSLRSGRTLAAWLAGVEMPKPIPWARGVAIGLGLGLALLAFLMVTRGGGCQLQHYSESEQGVAHVTDSN
jgi:hypothetical protein